MDFIRKNRLIIILTAIASYLLSAWAVHVDPVVNMDAILYLSAAEEFSQGSAANAMVIYRWPFYPALISGLQILTGSSTVAAAHTLNAILTIFCVTAFLSCVHALGGSRRTMIIAALVILLFPSINKYRPFIIRDIGFLACYLWAIYFYIKTIIQQKLLPLVMASLVMLGAILFRLEAIATLIIMPCYLFYLRSQTKLWRAVWFLLIVGASVCLFAGLTVWLFGESAVDIQHGGSYLTFFANSVNHAAENLWFKINIIGTKVLTPLSADFAPLILIIAVLLMTAYEPLRRLTFIHAFFAWYAIKRDFVLDEPDLRKAAYALCLIQIGLIAIFAAINMYLVSRHTLALVLTILLASPFGIEIFYLRWRHKDPSSPRWLFPLFAAFILAIGVHKLFDLKTDKLSVIDSGQWINENIAADQRVYSNNALLLHYAKRKPAHFNLEYSWQEADYFMQTGSIFDFHYVIFDISKNNLDAEKYIKTKLGSEPVHRIKNGEKNHLLVYDLRKHTKKRPPVDYHKDFPNPVVIN
ncbi:MAG: hypothetical protein ACRBHB_02205 [Arenicella sp.]